MTRKDPIETEPNWRGWAIWAGLFATTLVLGFACILVCITWPIGELSIAKAGVFGDSFGALNTLFSGLAFAGLVITLLMQRYDLKLQREEISETRREIRTQNFESTFFQMLRLHNDIVSSMRVDFHEESVDDDEPTTTAWPVVGRECFREFTRAFERHLKQNERALPRVDAGDLEGIKSAYRQLWEEHQKSLGHYFRYLYSIFKFIDQSQMTDRGLYSGIARAQLSDLELLLLYYNCLSPQGSENFGPIAERYALFDNLSFALIFHRKHLTLFDFSAWGSQSNAVRAHLAWLADVDQVHQAVKDRGGDPVQGK